MGRAGFLLLVATTLSCLGTTWGACKGSTKIECRTKGQCIRMEHVCNGGRDCTDNSDEDPELCKIWKFKMDSCSNSRVSCRGNCYSFSRFCNKKECFGNMHPRVCKMVKAKKFNVAREVELPAYSPAPLQMMSMISEVEHIVEQAVNATPAEDPHSCPNLYTRVGDRCLSLFSIAKVPWPEARQFCKSIFGDLVTFGDAQSFADLLRHLAEKALTTDFWIGGRFDSRASAWAWVSDDGTPMPLGSPFWAERYSTRCEPRPPPQIDPFSAPLNATPGAPCSHYLQAPKERAQGWCSAMTHEHHYYITDEECQNAHSPLCVFTRGFDIL
ncbi:LOW QUALITY PROTEIN: uncharacterized protein LOC119582430 [Penaeus monodon]|uniref:LOW QUALITY PROTEIN: uncharacterized protein LOC119582430 n=1 Tax=Penaeus monodon TaxID=6687 RepID=UPI0018A74667|nr:LOW QUALITY PROTEIN: uncharacterized protein LOC119582430 [Penaeus monodon]